MTSGPTKAIVAAVLGLPYRVSFGGRTLFQYAEDVARTPGRRQPDGAARAPTSSTCRVWSPTVRRSSAAIEAIVPGAAV